MQPARQFPAGMCVYTEHAHCRNANAELHTPDTPVGVNKSQRHVLKRMPDDGSQSEPKHVAVNTIDTNRCCV